VPEEWRSWELEYRYGETSYRVMFERVAAGSAVAQVLCDESPLRDGVVPLRDDGREHLIEVRVGHLAASTAQLLEKEKGAGSFSSREPGWYASINNGNEADPFSGRSA
jgi:hypothetical protein